MSKGLFVTGTGTDVGKTYVTALIAKTLREKNYNCGYYKAAISGAEHIEDSDAGYVNRLAAINQAPETLVSYLYKTAASPHLAANIEGNPVELDKVKFDYNKVCLIYEYLLVEGSGGIVCPIRYDEQQHIMLTEIIKLLKIPTVIIADAGLGTINATVLTIEYLKAYNIPVVGIIVNHFNGSKMQIDDIKMIELLTGFNVIATVKENDEKLDIEASVLASLFH